MNTIRTNKVSEFEALIEELRKQLLDACISLDIWEQLFPTKQAVDVINRYKGFFLPTINAHIDRFHIKVSNVISNDRRLPSFYKVLSILDNNPALAPGVNIRALRKRLRQHKGVLSAIEDYRNKRAAHWDTQAELQPGQVLLGNSKQMLEELQNIFNEISQAHSRNLWSFRPIQHDDTKRVLDALKKQRLPSQ
ncbi:hypothetical protein ACFLTQ_00135 [Chloroflexota bacterium]